ncbi:MAG: NAD(P)H-hydrate dehydratase [Kiritimatiellae bacterium]|nr:NAD(P)H-hydrate dehydratase [Kiritimatiellia bacterium]
MNLPENVKNAFPIRELDLNKRTVGTVTIIGGSPHFIHAPVIAALGARSAGAGLVQLVVPDSSRLVAGSHVPEATFTKLTPTCVPPKADVTVLGMGLGVSMVTELLVSRFLSGAAGRFVLDADALNILAKWYAPKSGTLPVTPGQEIILTPHEGEAARLLGKSPESVHANRMGAAVAISRKYHAVTVLKGAHTVVAAPGDEECDVTVCEAGNPQMALGGMGDLLAGAVAARWARLVHVEPSPTLSIAKAAAGAAVWLHAAAADELVAGDAPVEPNVVNVAAKMASLRILAERG